MKTPLVLAGFAVCALACTDPPLLEAPGASAVGVARAADAVALWEMLGRAKLVDTAVLKAVGPALVADAPVVASAMPHGAVVVATRIGAGASTLAAGAKPLLGGTSAVALGGETALVRVDGNRALVALHVPAGEESTVAALLELMASTKDAKTPPLPAPGSVHLRVAGTALPIALGDVDATATITPGASDVVVVHGDAAHPSEELRAALAEPPPSWTCALTDGAAATLAIPPIALPLAGAAESLDSFRGPVVIALWPSRLSPGAGIGLVLAGVPRDAAAAAELERTLTAAPGAVVRAKGGTRYVHVAGKDRNLHGVSGDGMFAVSVGDAPSLVGLGAAPCPAHAHLLSLHGPALAGVLGPALLDPRALLQAVLAGDAAAAHPLAALRGISALDVDVAPHGSGLTLDAHIALAAVTE